MLPPARRNPPTEPVRSDLDPLLRRFPALGSPVSAAWQSGTLGDSRVPGPTTYWIDAVITLDPDTAATLRKTPSLTPAPTPTVTPALAGHLPADAGWLTSRELQVALASSSWGCEAFLAADTEILVLLGVGDS